MGELILGGDWKPHPATLYDVELSLHRSPHDMSRVWVPPHPDSMRELVYMVQPEDEENSLVASGLNAYLHTFDPPFERYNHVGVFDPRDEGVFMVPYNTPNGAVLRAAFETRHYPHFHDAAPDDFIREFSGWESETNTGQSSPEPGA